MASYLATVPQLSDRALAYTHAPSRHRGAAKLYRRELQALLALIRAARANHEARHGPLPASDWAHVLPKPSDSASPA